MHSMVSDLSFPFLYSRHSPVVFLISILHIRKFEYLPAVHVAKLFFNSEQKYICMRHEHTPSK